MYDDFKVTNYPKSVVSPELYARHLSRLFTGDVIDGLTASPGTGLQVVLTPGNALIRYGSSAVASAREVSLVNNFNLAIGTPDASNPRIDLVVVYVDNSVSLPSGTPSAGNLDGKGVAKAKIVPGTPAATPAAPNATAIQASVGAGNPYTVVAQVRVDPGVSVIGSNKLTDVRTMALPGAQTVLEGTFTPSIVTADWGSTYSIDVSSFPVGSRLEIFAQAFINPTVSAQLLGLRIAGDLNPCLDERVNAGFRTLSTKRIVVRTAGITSVNIQTLGNWSAPSDSRNGYYSVRRVV